MTTLMLTEDNVRRLREVVSAPVKERMVTRAVFAGRFLEMGLIRVKVKRDGTRPYVLTAAGREALANGGK